MTTSAEWEAGRPRPDDRVDGFVTTLSCEGLGLQLSFPEAMELACEFGFDALEPDLEQLRNLAGGQVAQSRELLAERGLRWGWATVVVALHADAASFDRALVKLESDVSILQAAGVKQAATWIRPMSEELNYRENFTRQVLRIRQVHEVMAAAGIQLGLEYVGVESLRVSERYPFVYTLAGLQDLIAAVDRESIGVVLDSYHWYTAGETVADLLALPADQVMGVDLNDAPAGVSRGRQLDHARELPGLTGVIRIAEFIGALRQIGYAGPVRAEPFRVRPGGESPRGTVARAANALRMVLFASYTGRAQASPPITAN